MVMVLPVYSIVSLVAVNVTGRFVMASVAVSLTVQLQLSEMTSTK